MTFKLPTLYKTSSSGKVLQWTTWVEELSDGRGVIFTSWGYVGGAQQNAEDVVKTGKNAGKSNSTTAYEQACLEAQSQHVGKLKKGYVTDVQHAIEGKVDVAITGGISPMLAKVYEDHKKKCKWPTYVGCEEGRGKLAGAAIFVCKTSKGDVFNVKMKGSIDKLRAIWQARESYVGKLLTVQYQELTTAGIPRFPIGARLKEET